MRENNLSGLLAQVETPSLVVWGAEDNTVPLRDAGVVADEWPAADLRIVPKAGHWPHFEAPDITRRLVASFLGLPLLSDELTPVGDDELDRISELADFLTNSDLGANLRRTQLNRLAAQFRQMEVKPHSNIVNVDGPGNEMYLVQAALWKCGVTRKTLARNRCGYVASRAFYPLAVEPSPTTGQGGRKAVQAEGKNIGIK
jgi:hypothetical protein